jgi:hypothetical protein
MGHFLKFIFRLFSTTSPNNTPFPLLTTFFGDVLRGLPFSLLMAILRYLGETLQQVCPEQIIAKFVEQFR